MSFMLADVMFTAEEIVKYFDRPLLCEYKYDGIRVQMHKFGNVCKLYSRNLADISYAFPELTHSALDIRIKKIEKSQKEHDGHPNKSDADNIDDDNVNFILDGELMAFKNDRAAQKASGADPLVRAGSPGPAARVSPACEWPARGPAADQGVRPTIYAWIS